MNMKQLEAFRAVMVAGSVTGAAKILNVSQPGVSRLIGDLEQSIGLKLFQRRKGRLHPSMEGVNFYEELERSYAGMERLQQAAQEIKDLRRGHIRIAAMPALCLELMPSAISHFLSLYPEIKITLEAHSSPRIVEWITARHFDVGIGQLTLDQPGVQIKHSFRTRCVAVAPEGHAIERKKTVTIEDLEGESMVALSQHTLVALQIDQVFNEANTRRNIRIETQPSFTACALVAQGLGIAFVDSMTARFFEDRKVVIRPFEPSIPFDFRVITPTQVISSKLIDLFVAESREFFAGHDIVSPM